MTFYVSQRLLVSPARVKTLQIHVAVSSRCLPPSSALYIKPLSLLPNRHPQPPSPTAILSETSAVLAATQAELATTQEKLDGTAAALAKAEQECGRLAVELKETKEKALADAEGAKVSGWGVQ